MRYLIIGQVSLDAGLGMAGTRGWFNEKDG